MAWGVPKIGASVIDATGNFDLVEPVGVAQGDLMVACIAMRGNAVVTPPTGWVAAATQRNTGDTDATDGIASAAMFYIVRGASAPALTCTRTAGDVAYAKVLSYSGVNTSSPYDTGTSATQGAAGATPTTATFNTAEANELIVAFVAYGDQYTVSAFDAATDPATASNGTDTTTAPTAGTWIERFDANTNTGADTGIGIADAIRATAGATGTIQATVSSALGRNVIMAAAFKMAAPVISFAGTSAGTSTSSADVQLSKNLAGTSAGASTAAADLGLTKNLSGTSAGTSTANADLSIATIIELAGSSVGSSTASADVQLSKNLVASSGGTSTAAATFSVTKNLGAASSGTSTTGGTLLVTKNLGGSSAGAGTASATVAITRRLAGSSSGATTAEADLSVIEAGNVTLAGSTNGVAAASANMVISSITLSPPLTLDLSNGCTYLELDEGCTGLELETGETNLELTRQ